jgi:hypothetical protein
VSVRKILMMLFCSLLLGAVVAGKANAQGQPSEQGAAPALAPPFLEYAAKFACGQVPPRGPLGGGDADAVIGVYATSINIHNPSATVPVQLTKKIVVANQENSNPQNRGRIVLLRPDPPLQPDQAERVDCPLIFLALDTGATTHTEGFVVIEIPVNPNQQTFLDVVGKYSARPSTGEVSSLDVVVYSPREITR